MSDTPTVKHPPAPLSASRDGSAGSGANELVLAFHVAFAGARKLFDAAAIGGEERARVERAVQEQLVEHLKTVPEKCGFDPRHRPCGVASLAVGADARFAAACADLGWPLRVLLPQPRDEFLSADADGVRDFTDTEAESARQLLDSSGVIEVRVVSSSSNRTTRFDDVTLQLAHEADIVVCLRAHGEETQTERLIELARRMRRPVLELRVERDAHGAIRLASAWHVPPAPGAERRLPQEHSIDILARLGCDGADPTTPTSAKAYLGSLYTSSGELARESQFGFGLAAFVIVGTHVLATALALWTVYNHEPPAVVFVLFGELLLIGTGVYCHWKLHSDLSAYRWALTRLVESCVRSARAMASVDASLDYMLRQPLPESLASLVRTLMVAQRAVRRSELGVSWEARCQQYVAQRLSDPVDGQIKYYRRRYVLALRMHRMAQSVFYICAAIVLVVIVAKIAHTDPAHAVGETDLVGKGLGFLAVFIPVLAVAGLSLAAAFDFHAREETYRQMYAFLVRQRRLLKRPTSESEFNALATETETRLLGEAACWFTRRAFTGVA